MAQGEERSQSSAGEDSNSSGQLQLNVQVAAVSDLPVIFKSEALIESFSERIPGSNRDLDLKSIRIVLLHKIQVFRQCLAANLDQIFWKI